MNSISYYHTDQGVVISIYKSELQIVPFINMYLYVDWITRKLTATLNPSTVEGSKLIYCED